MKVIETERLTLRWMEPTDASFILELLNEPAWLQYIGDRNVKTLEAAHQYINKWRVEAYAKLGFGLYLTELKEGEVPVGICGLIKRESLKDVDIGFALHSGFWGHGYAYEAADAVLTHARRELGLKRVVAITSQDNERSIQLLEKLGLRNEGMVQMTADEPELKLFGIDF